MKNLIKFIFERVPVLQLLDGYKRKYGRIVMFAGAALALVAAHFPEYAILTEANAYFMLLLGYLGFEVGNVHAKAKGE